MRWIVCVALAMGLVLAVGLGLREFSTTLFTAQGPSQKFQAVSIEGQPTVAASVRGQRELVVGCLEALSTSATAFQAPQDVARVAARCQDVAQDVLAATPTLSAAHMLDARARYLQDDFAGAVTGLQHSVQTGPRTLWLAVRRVQLARALPEAMQPLVSDELDADVALMFESGQGRRVLALYYQRDRDFRPIILAVAETRPDEEQRSFLGMTRNVLSGAGS